MLSAFGRENQRYHEYFLLKVPMRSKQNHIVAAISLLIALTSCSSSRHINWHYIIPNDYQGYLAIRFECPGGTPLGITNGVARIEYAPDGTYCTSDSLDSSWSDSAQAWSTNGKPIPVAARDEETGYILRELGTRRIGGGTVSNPGEDVILSYSWVGDTSKNEQKPSELDAFLEQFGIRNISTEEVR